VRLVFFDLKKQSPIGHWFNIHVNAREEAPLAGVSELMCGWLPIVNWENDSQVGNSP
jgi:hypothetical protein